MHQADINNRAQQTPEDKNQKLPVKHLGYRDQTCFPERSASTNLANPVELVA